MVRRRSERHVPSDISKDTTIVLLPGMHGTPELFDRFVALCPAGFRTLPVAYPPDRFLSLHQLVEAVRSALPPDRWLLLAESFSGAIAIELAAAKPPGLLGLVLVASAARWSRLRLLRAAPLALLFSLPAPTALLRWLFIGSGSPELLAATRRAVRAASPRVLAARLRELATTDVRPQLSQLELPVLYLRAKHDRLARHAELRSVQSAAAALDVRVVDAPHFLVQSNPAATWEHLVSFARSRCAA